MNNITNDSAVAGKKAIVLLSGGLDSATCLAIARDRGYACYALSFAYGQRHEAELHAAKAIGAQLGVIEHRIVTLDIGQFGASALTDLSIKVPEHHMQKGIPNTYVPARNTIFLSIALGFAEAIGAHDIFIGANAVDYSGYPDCRPEFIETFQKLANLATKDGIEGKLFTIHAPLMQMTKAGIIQTGIQLGIDYAQTVSCYQLTSNGEACGKCDSCMLRHQGFKQANLDDPTRYKK